MTAIGNGRGNEIAFSEKETFLGRFPCRQISKLDGSQFYRHVIGKWPARLFEESRGARLIRFRWFSSGDSAQVIVP